MNIRRIALATGVVFFATTAAAFSPESAPSGYSYYSIGDINAPKPARTETGLMLMGGGGWVKEAFHWLVHQGGGGHFVILRASGADDLQKELYEDIGGVSSVQTLVFSNRKAASDPRVLRIVRQADGIGGDGGMIAMDGKGRIALSMNTSGMYRGWVTSDGSAKTAIYSGEPDVR